MAHRPFIIGITGGSGSGKTTFIRRLRERFSEEEVCIISQDDYYRPREEQEADEFGVKNFDLPRSIDKKAFLADIKRLIRGEVVTRPEYTFNNPDKEPRLLTFKPAPILVIEGLFVLHYKKIRKRLDRARKGFAELKEREARLRELPLRPRPGSEGGAG